MPHGNFFVDPSDNVVGACVLWTGAWQRAELLEAVDLVRKAGRLPEQAVFIDVGANIGTQTVYAMRTGAFSRAVAFEPEPRNAELLAMNMGANGLGDQVAVIRKAAGSRSGRAVMHLHPRNKGAHSLAGRPSRDGAEIVDVEVVRLDETIAAHGIGMSQIGLVWMDVEGSETEALLGLGEHLGNVPLVLEFLPERFDNAEGLQMLQRLQQSYSVMYRIGEARGPEDVKNMNDIRSMIDILLL